MEQFRDDQRYPLWSAQREAQGVRQLIREGEAKDYAEASELCTKIKLDITHSDWPIVFGSTTPPNPETCGLATKEELKVMASELNDDVEFVEGFEPFKEHYQANDGYRWVLIDGKYVPADECWQPLDLSPCELDQKPWPGDFCYVSMHLDCQDPDCKDTPRQLALVWMVDEVEGFANIMLVNDDPTKATNQDVILNSDETRIPFDVVVEFSCGPVFFDQLSEPVGWIDQNLIDRFLDATLDGTVDFPPEKRGLPTSGEDDSKYEFASKRLNIMHKLSCYCMSKYFYEDALANQEDPKGEDASDEFEIYKEDIDDTNNQNDFEYEDDNQKGHETDNKDYMGY